MASLGFPGIVSISFHSTTGHRYPWEIQMHARVPDELMQTSIQGELLDSDCRKSISVTIEV